MSMALTKSKRGHCKMLIKKEKYQKETSFFPFQLSPCCKLPCCKAAFHHTGFFVRVAILRFPLIN